VPDLVFTNNQVKIGANTYNSNPIIEKDYNEYKNNKTPDTIEKILDDIKILKDGVQVKDNTPSKVKTLSSIFEHNQSVLNATKPTNNVSTDNLAANNRTSNHINITQPTKEGARLMDTYQ